MYVIDPLQSITVKLTSAVTTNPVAFSANFTDTNGAVGSNSFNQSTNTVNTLVGAPLYKNQRQVNMISIVNADTASTTVTVAIAGAGAVTIQVITLTTGQKAIYESGSGWTIYDNTGKPINQYGQTLTINPQAGATYSPVASDFNGNVVVEMSNSGAITVTMPPPTSVAQKQVMKIKLTSPTASITINPNAAETIDGASTITGAAPSSDNITFSIGIYREGANWLTLK